MRFINLTTILVRKEYLAKINNLPKHHGAGPTEARGPMQPHRLHRLKAGPDYCNSSYTTANIRRPLAQLEKLF